MEDKKEKEKMDQIKSSQGNKDDSSASSDVSGKENEKDDVTTVSYKELFRFADGFDVFLIILGSLCGIIHGAGLPALFIIFGELTTVFTDYGKYQQCDFIYVQCFNAGLYVKSEAEFNAEVIPLQLTFRATTVQFVVYFVYVAVGVFFLATLQTSCWTLQAVSDVDKVKNGMADKVSTSLQYISMAIAGLVVGLAYSWKVALVTLSVSPLLVISTALMLKVTAIFDEKELNAYAKAGSIAEETISAIRTVMAFGCQIKESDRYVGELNGIKKVGVRKGFAGGLSIGFLYLSVFGMYGLAFWYGTTIVISGEISIGALTTTFFGILIAAFSLGTAGSYVGAFSEARVAGAKIFEVIDRIPEIDVFSDDGDSPNPVGGKIELKHVHFTYPTRPDVQVLEDVSLTIEQGKTTALVGQSGCGKSTTIQLIQRFYDCSSGDIFVGGKNVKDLNVRKHRQLIGVVSQEPILFATTIAENIRWGREEATDAEVEDAAKKANAYDFINKLPQKFETLVGEGGGQMSGGQKQRIAIARAIVRNPKILLLDEATSALDTESESIVQAALEKASAGRTTVVIAHRLSTIRNADKIIAFQDGRVVEQGSHEELLKIEDGVYANLINMQAGREEDDLQVTMDEDMALEEPENPDVKIVPNGMEKRERYFSNSSQKLKTVSVRRKESLEKKKKWKEEEEEEEEEYLPDVGFLRILKMNKPEWIYMTVGCLFSAIAGAIDPVNAVIFAEVLNIFTLSNPDEQSRRATLYGLLFLALGGVGLIAYIMESTLFAKSGVELTVRLREKAFRSLLRQDISYFDDHRNSTGALCTRLSTDASRVQGCTGVRLGVVVKNFCSLGVALGIAFAFGWQLTLLTLAFVPFLALGGFLEFSLLTGQEEVEKEAYESAGQISGEAIKNIRTVASMTKEKLMHDMYLNKLQNPYKKTRRRALIVGLGYGYSQCVIYFAYAAVFRLGIELVILQAMTFDNVFKVLTAVIFGAIAVGQNSSFAPDYAEAKTSAKRMFALIDQTPEIDAYSDAGLSPAHCKGEISLNSVFFHYPTRPDVPILKGCSVSVKPGQTLALVGQSGCGKSTSVQLIERFYDPKKGSITFDGIDIRDLNVSWLRQQMGLVSQEPVLFDQSIRENIQYGDCTREASLEEVEQAARNANIHNFITTLPDGYETSVGAKGGKLSGGQKQRVAIARALLRNPKVLLLDEATSALDNESEKIVQEALDAAREGRTCITIAHRLSTVRSADQIAVIDNGVVVEVGTHEQLIAEKGAYFSLVNAQLTDKDKE